MCKRFYISNFYERISTIMVNFFLLKSERFLHLWFLYGYNTIFMALIPFYYKFVVESEVYNMCEFARRC